MKVEMRSAAKVGIFDSGVGGLTVLKEIRRLLPHESLIYLGDTARVPYGIRSPEVVIGYTREALKFFERARVELVVVACNTASAVALEELQKEYSVPLIGVIEPGAARVVQTTRSNRVGVIGTETTIRSGAYRSAIFRHNPRVEVWERACPLFVPLVEEGWARDPIAGTVARRYLGELKKGKIDTLLLGCTHYPLLKGVIRRVLSPSVRIIDSAREVAKEVAAILKRGEFLQKPSRSKPEIQFFVTDAPERFQKIGIYFLGHTIRHIQKISLV